MVGIFNSAIFNNSIFNTGVVEPVHPPGGDDAPSMDDIRRYKKYIEELKEYRRLKREAEKEPQNEEILEEIVVYEEKNYDIDYSKLTSIQNIMNEIRAFQVLSLKAQIEYELWRRKQDDELAILLLI